MNEELLKQSKNQTSYVCLRSADLRKGKTNLEMSAHDAMVIANREYADYMRGYKMKSSYEIQLEMENKFGKDFIQKMKSQKNELEKFEAKIEEAKTFEQKVNDKVNQLRKTFIYISDNNTIYPDEVCRNYLYQFAKQCIKENPSKELFEELHYEYELEVIKELESNIISLQEEIKICKQQWEEKTK